MHRAKGNPVKNKQPRGGGFRLWVKKRAAPRLNPRTGWGKSRSSLCGLPHALKWLCRWGNDGFMPMRRGERLAVLLRMQIVTVGRGGLEVSSDPDVVLITEPVCPSLAIATYEPAVRVGGVLHFEMPDSSADPALARHQPGLFADTGISLLIEEVCRRGAQKPRLQTRLSGSAPADAAPADITSAKRNYLAARKTLWKRGVVISADTFGRAASATAGLQIGSGAPWPGADHP